MPHALSAILDVDLGNRSDDVGRHIHILRRYTSDKKVQQGRLDSGIGIPAEEQEHLFERFFRAANTSGISGTGLGLSIVKKYLDLMGGYIEVISEPGNGTIFTFTIPAAEVPGNVMTGKSEIYLHR